MRDNVSRVRYINGTGFPYIYGKKYIHNIYIHTHTQYTRGYKRAADGNKVHDAVIKLVHARERNRFHSNERNNERGNGYSM